MPNDKSRPATYDHLVKKKPAQVVQYVPLNDDAVDEYEAAQQELQTARLLGNPERTDAALERVREATETLRDPSNSIRIVHRALGRSAYRALLAEHPPKPEDVARAKDAGEDPPEWDTEGLAPALIAATVIEPKMTVEQVRALPVSEGEESPDGLPGLGWNDSEFAVLFNTSLTVNNRSRISDFSF